ncbi:hypothetical protein ACLOJK_003567 [Asimina triloba]
MLGAGSPWPPIYLNFLMAAGTNGLNALLLKSDSKVMKMLLEQMGRWPDFAVAGFACCYRSLLSLVLVEIDSGDGFIRFLLLSVEDGDDMPPANRRGMEMGFMMRKMMELPDLEEDNS